MSTSPARCEFAEEAQAGCVTMPLGILLSLLAGAFVLILNAGTGPPWGPAGAGIVIGAVAGTATCMTFIALADLAHQVGLHPIDGLPMRVGYVAPIFVSPGVTAAVALAVS